jgi:GNAT superfamily N-acetyltransferase
MLIRQAALPDIDIIVDFQQKMALETENLSLQADVLEQGIRHFFYFPEQGFYLIAESEAQVVGCMLIQHEWSDWRNGKILWLHSVYVVPEFRNKGTFALLYAHVQQMVNDDSAIKGIRLYVDKGNTVAAKVYERMGMSNAHYELFEWLSENK